MLTKRLDQTHFIKSNKNGKETDFSRVLTTMRGTRGYLAPEWISGVAITAKADVYSYGMMIFEVVSGRRNSEQSEDGKVKFFPSYVASQINQEDGDFLSLLDHRLEGVADLEELTRICKTAIIFENARVLVNWFLYTFYFLIPSKPSKIDTVLAF
ncbi:hypothetical protein DKX38_029875 [Salix brachista]|uniref:Protein kinase domain-containing protein n=1 Tax=Salix brachista TaxID=2182728 RepID=A0A5N5JCG0_9ROSI|nr:hypothetical protein DKX38_029875 [Salix brachista]